MKKLIATSLAVFAIIVVGRLAMSNFAHADELGEAAKPVETISDEVATEPAEIAKPQNPQPKVEEPKVTVVTEEAVKAQAEEKKPVDAPKQAPKAEAKPQKPVEIKPTAAVTTPTVNEVLVEVTGTTDAIVSVPSGYVKTEAPTPAPEAPSEETPEDTTEEEPAEEEIPEETVPEETVPEETIPETSTGSSITVEVENHLHEEVQVGGYTYVYCSDEPIPRKDGFTIYYPYEFYF